MKTKKASKWKRVIQRDASALIANQTWKVVKFSKNGILLIVNWIRKTKKILIIFQRIQILLSWRWIRKREDVDYLQTFTAFVKPLINKV